MLTRQLPFKADDIMGWIYCHLSKIPTAVKKKNAEVPNFLNAIVLKLIEKIAENRYQSSYGIIKELNTLFFSE